MNNVNQLLSKAMSTTNEEEAIACFRMARKRNGGKTLQLDNSNEKNEISIYKTRLLDAMKLIVHYRSALDSKESQLIELKEQIFYRNVVIAFLIGFGVMMTIVFLINA